MLTNALSHERMTPLNSIVNVTENVRRYCQKKVKNKPNFDSVRIGQQEFLIQNKLEPPLKDYKLRQRHSPMRKSASYINLNRVVGLNISNAVEEQK